MSTLTIVLPFGIRFTVTPLRWFGVLLCALVALLIWGYVAVLDQGVERGNQMRQEQQRAATQPKPTKAPAGVVAVKATQP